MILLPVLGVILVVCFMVHSAVAELREERAERGVPTIRERNAETARQEEARARTAHYAEQVRQHRAALATVTGGPASTDQPFSSVASCPTCKKLDVHALGLDQASGRPVRACGICGTSWLQR